MKLNKGYLKKMIKEALEKVDWDNPSASWDANDQDNRERGQEYTSSGTFSSAGSEARHAARRREERGAPGRTIYALINIPYEPSIVVSENSMEALRKEISEWVDNPLGASVEAIFYADIIEGEL